MKNIKIIAFIVVLVVGGILFYFSKKYESVLANGKKAPESTKVLDSLENDGFPNFTLEDTDGKKVSLHDFKGKIVILNFWASWCEPCVQEFPSMLNLLDKFKGEVVLLAVSHDADEDDMKNFLKAFNSKKQKDNGTLSIVWDKDKKISEMFAIEALPESFLIDREMKLIRKVAGSENWFAPDAVAYFESLVNKTKTISH